MVRLFIHFYFDTQFLVKEWKEESKKAVQVAINLFDIFHHNITNASVTPTLFQTIYFQTLYPSCTILMSNSWLSPFALSPLNIHVYLSIACMDPDKFSRVGESGG